MQKEKVAGVAALGKIKLIKDYYYLLALFLILVFCGRRKELEDFFFMIRDPKNLEIQEIDFELCDPDDQELMRRNMDTGEGRFEMFESEEELKKNMHRLFNEYPRHGGVFKVGEVLEIKGSMFRVKSVKPKELRLKLLPK